MGVFGIDHIAFRTADPGALRAFYLELLGAEEVNGSHGALRVGATTLVFFEGEARGGEDEIAFDADSAGFARAWEAAGRLGCVEREPVSHTPASRGFVVRDPDGRRIEVMWTDEGAFWRE